MRANWNIIMADLEISRCWLPQMRQLQMRRQSAPLLSENRHSELDTPESVCDKINPGLKCELQQSNVLPCLLHHFKMIQVFWIHYCNEWHATIMYGTLVFEFGRSNICNTLLFEMRETQHMLQYTTEFGKRNTCRKSKPTTIWIREMKLSQYDIIDAPLIRKSGLKCRSMTQIQASDAFVNIRAATWDTCMIMY